MIGYENLDMDNLIDALESLAYRVLHYKNPTWHSIPEEEIIQLLKEEGIDAYADNND